MEVIESCMPLWMVVALVFNLNGALTISMSVERMYSRLS